VFQIGFSKNYVPEHWDRATQRHTALKITLTRTLTPNLNSFRPSCPLCLCGESLRRFYRSVMALLFSGAPGGEVSKVAPIDKLSVVVAMALAILFLRERINPREGLGAGLIVLGAVLLALK
jgi:EamA-like transporter family